MKRIDAHQHFWLLLGGDYDWLTPDFRLIYRDFLPQDLTPLLQASDIDETILVQAAPTLEETEYMLTLANKHDFIKGVVSQVDFETTDGVNKITELASHSIFVGLRPMIENIEDHRWMLKESLEPEFRALINSNLCFEALVTSCHLDNLNVLLSRYPQLRVVIDHAGKPDILNRDFSRWSEQMRQLAQYPTVFCKLSGLVTEVGSHWQIDQLRSYLDHIIRVFGAKRVMWSSDWPVCTLVASYSAQYDSTQELIIGLSDKEQSYIMGGSATSIYQLLPQRLIKASQRSLLKGTLIVPPDISQRVHP